MAALIAGERDPKKLAEMARSRMRPKIGLLEEAFAGLPFGTFDDHHRFLLARMLARIDAVDADIAALDAQIEEHLAPFADAVARLDQIPGIGPTAAAVIIAEIGTDMTRFPTPAHLSLVGQVRSRDQVLRRQDKGNGSTGTATATSPARSARPPSAPPAPTPSSAPATDASPAAAGRRRPSSRSADPSWSSSGTCSPTPTPASTTSAPTSTTATSTPTAKKRNHIRQLEALGYRVTLEPAA